MSVSAKQTLITLQQQSSEKIVKCEWLSIKKLFRFAETSEAAVLNPEQQLSKCLQIQLGHDSESFCRKFYR